MIIYNSGILKPRNDTLESLYVGCYPTDLIYLCINITGREVLALLELSLPRRWSDRDSRIELMFDLDLYNDPIEKAERKKYKILNYTVQIWFRKGICKKKEGVIRFNCFDNEPPFTCKESIRSYVTKKITNVILEYVSNFDEGKKILNETTNKLKGD